MHLKCLHQLGFTVVELLVVIALMLIMSALLLQGFVGYGQLQKHRQVTNDVTNLLQTARQQSQTRTDDDAYGVWSTATSLTLFAQSATATAVRTIAIPTQYSIISSLSDGQPYLTFARRTGVPSATGTFAIVDTIRQATTTVIILPSGLVE